MKQQKAKYYPELEEIVPIVEEVNLLELDNPTPKLESKGSDEKGDWILVSFIFDEDEYFEYDSDKTNKQVKQIEEKEWSSTPVEEVSEITQSQLSSVNVDANSSKKSLLTNLKSILPTFQTVKEKWTQSIGSLF